MTLAELAAASRQAGEALSRYRDNWTEWRKSAKSQLAGYKAALTKEVKRLDDLREALAGTEQRLRELDRLIASMTDPPTLHPDIGSVASCHTTGETVGVPPELRPILGALSMFTRPRGMCGIYFLVRGASVVYVGQSVDVASRVTAHTDKQFDRVFFLEAERHALDRVEGAFIRLLRPEYNRAGVEAASTEADHRVVDEIVRRCG